MPTWKLVRINLNIFIVFGVLAASFAFQVPAARAELPPAAYRQMQKTAPEYIRIEVLSVRTVDSTDAIGVTVEAKVTAVTRSASGLENGRVIRITYSHDTRTLPGPSPVPVLKRGRSYPAFLTKARNRDVYDPAAGGKSFEVVK